MMHSSAAIEPSCRKSVYARTPLSRQFGILNSWPDSLGRSIVVLRKANEITPFSYWPAPQSRRLLANSMRRNAPALAPSATRTANSPSRRTFRVALVVCRMRLISDFFLGARFVFFIGPPCVLSSTQLGYHNSHFGES